ncbi:hypothetical protein EIP91_009430 [Steccherinum ochraceum]|uniref:F-box domain-containing protein n=1 Tax=Steccherinum ochraceum TaxID=92696 RepID=A0A4V2MV38_9APHY|nr:hypothetical protein EIP91_009430 [Steccherinum ochraceum]
MSLSESRTGSLHLPTELVDQIISDVATQGGHKDVKTCASVCKQWHAVCLRYLFRRVTFALEKEECLIFFRQLIELYPWLPSCIQQAKLAFKPGWDDAKHNTRDSLIATLDTLPQLAPQLQTLIFVNGRCPYSWECRALSRRLPSIAHITTLRLQSCVVRMTDIKMFLRGFPNLKHLEVSATSVLSGDSKVSLASANVPRLISLRINLHSTNKAATVQNPAAKLLSLLMSSLAANGVPALSLAVAMTAIAMEEWPNLVKNLLRTIGPSLKYLRWYWEPDPVWYRLLLSVNNVDLSSNVRLHTLVICCTHREPFLSTGTASVDSIQPGALRRIMLPFPHGSDNKQDEVLSGFALQLSQNRFHNVTEIYFGRASNWSKRSTRSMEQCGEAVRKFFGVLLARGVSVNVVEEEEARSIADQWEQDTVAEDS